MQRDRSRIFLSQSIFLASCVELVARLVAPLVARLVAPLVAPLVPSLVILTDASFRLPFCSLPRSETL